MVLYDTYGDGWNNGGLDLFDPNGNVVFSGGGPSYVTEDGFG